MADTDNKPPLEPVTTAETDSPTSVSSWPSSQANICEVESGEVSLETRRAITRKLDIHIIPVVVLLYLVNFLDRINIGNSKLYGIEEDLGLVGNQFQICVAVLFIPYCLLEVPSTLIIKKAQPNIYLGFIAVAWGITATLTGLCRSYGGLIAIRLVMGTVESGLYPGLVVYLTMFYTRKQLGIRLGYIGIGSATAGSVGGLIAYGVGFLDGVSGLRAWRWLMIIEGLPSILVGIAAYLILPSSIPRARFLSPSERSALLTLRRATDTTGHQPQPQQHNTNTNSESDNDNETFHWADVRAGARDWQIWAFALTNFAQDLLLYGHATFLPTIIRGLGRWSAVQSQALTAPVYAAAITTYLVIAYCSDRSGPKRGPFVCGSGLVVAGGYAMLLLGADRGAALSYAGCCVAAAGQYVQGTLSVAWLAGNKPRYGKRAFATGVQISIGNSAGIVAPFLYPNKDAPTYKMGYEVAVAAAFVSVAVSAVLSGYYVRVNRARGRGEEDWRVEGKSEAEVEGMGDRSPRYVYVI